MHEQRPRVPPPPLYALTLGPSAPGSDTCGALFGLQQSQSNDQLQRGTTEARTAQVIGFWTPWPLRCLFLQGLKPDTPGLCFCN